MHEFPNLEEGYRPAAVCRRGHVAASDLTEAPDAATTRCSRCGAEVLTNCAKCGHRIRGEEYRAGYVGWYTKPEFCDSCGAPHPWLSRQGRIFVLQNMLDELDLDEADRLNVQEELATLSGADLPDEEQQERLDPLRLSAVLAPAALQALHLNLIGPGDHLHELANE